MLVASPVLCAEENEKPWATPEPAGDMNSFGANIQRTMSRLASSTPEKRNHVRILLKKHGLVVKDTLRDTVHPNELGNFLIAELVKPHLRHRPDLPVKQSGNLVQDIPIGDERVKRNQDGSISLTFSGNRIDIIAAPVASGASARVSIDGKAPSTFPELYYHARPSPTPVAGRPAFNRIDHQAPLLVETWTARILECDIEADVLRYEISGSKTGFDGIGDHKERFVSNSGRVIIEPRMWMVNWSLRYRKQTLPTDYKVTWETKPLFVDTWEAPREFDPVRESTRTTTLAQGLENREHTLILKPVGETDSLPVAAFRVFRPRG